MCVPAVVLAVGSLAASAAGAYMTAKSNKTQAKTAQAQATLDAENNQRQADLSNFNATEIERYGKLNTDLVIETSSLNNRITQSVADANVGIINATSDFNVGMIRATTDFNVSSAEGAARMIEARGEAEAGLHRGNADLLEVQAQDSLEAGNQAERQSRGSYAQLKGSQRAMMAANGVALDEGSALRIQSDTDYASDVDADTIKTNAIKAAFGYRVTAVQERTSAEFASLDGKAQGMQKRGEALAAKINGAVGIAQTDLNRGVDTLNTKMTASMQILQNNQNTKVDLANIKNQTEADAWAARARAVGYTGQAAQSKLTASSIKPNSVFATSLVNGAAKVASQWYGFQQAGAFAKT